MLEILDAMATENGLWDLAYLSLVSIILKFQQINNRKNAFINTP